jgi:hypothetical protein
MRPKHVFLVGVSTVAACVGVPAAAQVANPVIPAETTQATAAEAPSASAQTVPQPDVVPNVDDPAGDASTRLRRRTSVSCLSRTSPNRSSASRVSRSAVTAATVSSSRSAASVRSSTS